MKNIITHKMDLEAVRGYIKDHPKAKIYAGCDSQRFKKNGKWNARFIACIIVYEKDHNKIFAEISVEKDYDSNPSKPVMRLMQEVYKISAIVLELQDDLKDREFEVHLDINPRKTEGSHCAFNQAVGYVLGMHGITPVVKPDAWAASCVSDHLVKHKEATKYKGTE